MSTEVKTRGGHHDLCCPDCGGTEMDRMATEISTDLGVMVQRDYKWDGIDLPMFKAMFSRSDWPKWYHMSIGQVRTMFVCDDCSENTEGATRTIHILCLTRNDDQGMGLRLEWGESVDWDGISRHQQGDPVALVNIGGWP